MSSRRKPARTIINPSRRRSPAYRRQSLAMDRRPTVDTRAALNLDNASATNTNLQHPITRWILVATLHRRSTTNLRQRSNIPAKSGAAIKVRRPRILILAQRGGPNQHHNRIRPQPVFTSSGSSRLG
ncbi:hypothetical protein IHE45_20G087800 [Dioscorea alata]|uniref:Uncharacterized protein n=1 Tax=Dioscorea alata TaxID=55571 RepID=A0ACB7TW80_DIOAL|nr:hypothetical protein IHE45_20G087800 [Dioscorea alata]